MMVMEMSKTYQYRKVMKPLLERKRRARINKCLDDLKELMVECLQQEGEHVTRLEKADILELTVEHMRKLKQRGTLSLQSTHNTTHVESFRSGYVHAADQISQVLLQQRQTDEIGHKIMKFLSTRLIEMQHQLIRNSTVTPTGAMSPAMQLTPTPNDGYIMPVTNTATTINSLTISPAATPTMSFGSYDDNLPLNYEHERCFNAKDNDLVDVTTIDHSNASDSTSVISVDSAISAESVWRPW